MREQMVLDIEKTNPEFANSYNHTVEDNKHLTYDSLKHAMTNFIEKQNLAPEKTKIIKSLDQQPQSAELKGTRHFHAKMQHKEIIRSNPTHNFIQPLFRIKRLFQNNCVN